jgi:hypothetical protein
MTCDLCGEPLQRVAGMAVFVRRDDARACIPCAGGQARLEEPQDPLPPLVLRVGELSHDEE